jgi:hypothetical protein
LAMRDRTAPAANGLNPAVPTDVSLGDAPALSASEPTVNLADNGQVKIEPAATLASQADGLGPSTHVAERGGATELSSQITNGVDEIASAKIKAGSAAAPAAVLDAKRESGRIAAAAPPVAQQFASGSRTASRQFSQQSAVQSFRNNAQAGGAGKVLNTFEVRQEGNDIRVLDGDGSMYTGKIEQPTKSAERDSGIAARPDAAKQTQRSKSDGEAGSVAPQSYFRASGYNVSLKKTLVFEGNYAAAPSQQPATTFKDRERAEPGREPARIVGTVRVNGEAPLQVDAIAQTPETDAPGKNQK